MLDGTEPIADEEELYRRIPVSPNWYDPAVDSHPSPRAFRPIDEDKSGLSLYRAKYKSIRQVAENLRGKRYYVAVLRAGALREYGIKVVPKPIPPHDLGHAEIPSLTYTNRKEQRAVEQQLLLAEKLCLRVEGPFPEIDETQ